MTVECRQLDGDLACIWSWCNGIISVNPYGAGSGRWQMQTDSKSNTRHLAMMTRKRSNEESHPGLIAEPGVFCISCK